MEIKGAAVIVTGASSGIGRATAQRLSESGARLVLAARGKAGLEAAAREARDAGAEAIIQPTDVTQAAEVEAMAQAAVSHFGRIDALVNAAGVFATASLTDQDEGDFDRQIAVNLKSVFLTSRAVATWMIGQGAGHIVNVLSIAAREAFPDNGAYCASKWGALGLTKVLAEELRPRRIRVTAILPGATDTPAWDAIDWAPDRARMMHPRDVAEAILTALAAPPSANTDEIVLTPPGGTL